MKIYDISKLHLHQSFCILLELNSTTFVKSQAVRVVSNAALYEKNNLPQSSVIQRLQSKPKSTFIHKIQILLQMVEKQLGEMSGQEVQGLVHLLQTFVAHVEETEFNLTFASSPSDQHVPSWGMVDNSPQVSIDDRATVEEDYPPPAFLSDNFLSEPPAQSWHDFAEGGGTTELFSSIFSPSTQAKESSGYFSSSPFLLSPILQPLSPCRPVGKEAGQEAPPGAYKRKRSHQSC